MEHRGKLNEFDIFGYQMTQSAWYSRARELGANERGFLPYEKAVELAREFQPSDPTNPETDFPNDLRIAIIERLEEKGLLEPDKEDSVKFYSAIGMPLDIYHGVDAFIEVEDSEGNIYRVTLDETTNPKKLAEGHKANLVFAPLPDAVEEQDKYLREVDQLADDALEFFSRDIKQRAAA
jgi:hypothetical protein